MDIKSFADETIAHYQKLLAEGKSDKEAAEGVNPKVYICPDCEQRQANLQTKRSREGNGLSDKRK